MIPDETIAVYGGIDTHADTHHVAVIDGTGRRLGDTQVPATPAGYRAAVRFLDRWPALSVVGVECTGSYGAGVTRVVCAAGMRVIEVNRPNRFDRRMRGKTDTYDAYSAAEAVLSGRASAAPKGGDGLVESLAGGDGRVRAGCGGLSRLRCRGPQPRPQDDRTGGHAVLRAAGEGVLAQADLDVP